MTEVIVMKIDYNWKINVQTNLQHIHIRNMNFIKIALDSLTKYNSLLQYTLQYLAK